MFKFTLTAIETEQVFIGRGKFAVGALDDLCDTINLYTGVSPRADDDNYIQLLECALEAAAKPNEVVEKRDFSTPEDNFDIVFEKD